MAATVCQSCNETMAAKDCAYGKCGNCCDGNGCARHGSDGNERDRYDQRCPECGVDDDVSDVSRNVRKTTYRCTYCNLEWDGDTEK